MNSNRNHPAPQEYAVKSSYAHEQTVTELMREFLFQLSLTNCMGNKVLFSGQTEPPKKS